MEEPQKQSSVALGFQGVLISICSSETRGIERQQDKKENSLQQITFPDIFFSMSYLWNNPVSDSILRTFVYKVKGQSGLRAEIWGSSHQVSSYFRICNKTNEVSLTSLQRDLD